MKGDFSRITFDPRKRYTGVRLQQGRVQLDADFNEQADIVQHLIRTQVADALGPAGTSSAADGFAVRIVTNQDSRENEPPSTQPTLLQSENIEIGSGRFYVRGMVCENEQTIRLGQRSEHIGDWPDVEGVTRALIYLDVWERHVTADAEPGLRDAALQGSDTATRTKLQWQIGVLPLDSAGDANEDANADADGDEDEGEDEDASRKAELPAVWTQWLAERQAAATLEAHCRPLGMSFDNHLYRVEIHDSSPPSFKWSRDNGSVAFRVEEVEVADQRLPGIAVLEPGKSLRVRLEGLQRRGMELQQGDLVELTDDRSIRAGTPLPLCTLESIDIAARRVTLTIPSQAGHAASFEQHALSQMENAVLIRWDQPATGAAITGPTEILPGQWHPLEHGIEVQFHEDGPFRAGDYWAIPARAELEGIQWPDGQSQPPHGIAHHFWPLATVAFTDGHWSVEKDWRPKFLPQTDVLPTLEDLEKRLRKEVKETEDRLTERIESLERNLGIQYFHSEHELEPGDVVSRVADSPDLIEPANEDNARFVAGVVQQLAADSHQRRTYRVLMQGEQELRVAGPVQAGDLLVPSTCDGRAKQAGLFIRPGTLIAKAVTSFEPDGDCFEGVVRAVIVLG